MSLKFLTDFNIELDNRIFNYNPIKVAKIIHVRTRIEINFFVTYTENNVGSI